MRGLLRKALSCEPAPHLFFFVAATSHLLPSSHLFNSYNQSMSSIRPCRHDERAAILAIINAAASAYRGVIPPDRWHEPYMAADELDNEMAAGVAHPAARAELTAGTAGEESRSAAVAWAEASNSASTLAASSARCTRSTASSSISVALPGESSPTRSCSTMGRGWRRISS